MQKRLSQNDPKWANVRIGRSKSFLGGNGCALVSLNMVINKIGKLDCTPDLLAKELTFVPVSGDADPRYLDWIQSREALEKYGIKFEERARYTSYEYERLKGIMNSATMGVIFQVQTKSGGQHWVYGWKPGILGPVCWDPWDGSIVYNLAGLFGKYPKITGFATFKKKLS